MRWAGRGLVGLVGLLVVAGAAGAIYQAAASAADRRNHPAPGVLVEVGGHRLHLWCTGSGSPTVVLEAGATGFSFDWSQIQEDIAAFTRVCAYDRAGLGWSEPVEAPLSSAEVAQDLHDLLTGAGEAGPYVVVGHSAGGIHVRSFARQFPAEVAGMVLVDSAHENHGTRLEVLDLVEQTQLSQLRMCSRLSPLGLMRVLGVHNGSVPDDDPVSADQRAVWLGRLNDNGFCGAALRDVQGYYSDIRQLVPPAALGTLPLVVLTRGRGVSLDELPSGEQFTQELVDETNRISREMQQELAALSTNSIFQIVPDSGHYIHWDQPAAVLQAVREMVASLQP